MTKYKITIGGTTIEFATETEAKSYVATNSLDVLVESFEEEIPLPVPDFIETVRNAINFGSELILEFTAENVALGITQAGKTKAVADYLADVMRYAQTGSLYEVIAEVDRLILNGLPNDLSPFITETRLNFFKKKIEDYLGI